ncbi:hypothetical protein RHAL1_03842 [Beijerinckiaceae bacterium RH AL1]|nr:alpha/beta hydrolase [Beijerinckiaceae bacterium]VVB49447.1 hypothetical protein RHCH11_RHCH11_03768 [Beijerinckiaceae bacterium RH CH11]VVB49528.1 hypothetical protein RHAL8_03764 [Beijerinckiaceae bacterium RH AL8]VVC56907.1 hypothetical protein RHAL1_03842 [Beijerinckiaceae bacterium RH AL1]
MTTRAISFPVDGGAVSLGLDELGEGPRVLLLPAMSSISTRREMVPLMERLSARFHAMTVDWPGFGDRERPRADWSPAVLTAFLDRVLHEHAAGAVRAIVAAGHAAPYALAAVARKPGVTERLVLVAPTWRGPFPTMMRGQRPWFARACAAVDHPLLGPAFYGLNVSKPVIDRMVREHVYSDPAWLAGERYFDKLAVTRAAGARHASVRFVTGALDLVDSRDGFLDLARKAAVPILVVYGAETPRRSLAEIEAMEGVENVRLERLPRGKLAVHEEFPDKVAALVAPFIA